MSTIPALRNSSYYQSNSRQPQSSVPEETFTYESFFKRTLGVFLATVLASILGWNIPFLLIPAVAVSLVLGLVIGFKHISNPIATYVYSISQGVALGAVSMFMEQRFSGIVVQAVLATFAVFATILFLSSRKIFRTSPKLNKIFMVVGLGYLVFSIANVVLSLFGVFPSGLWGIYGQLGWLGVAIGVFGVVLASYSLVQDYEFIDNAVRNEAPRQEEWFAGWSLTASLVWLYTEILRVFSLISDLTN
jgi:uncharacterized YccA/Bax inhibitor family protein